MENQNGRPSPEQIRNALVFVRVSAHGWGCNRKLAEDEYETEGSKELTAASKNLTKDDRYKAMRQLVRATDRWLEEREVGVGFTGPGVRAIPVGLVEEVVAELEARRVAYFEAVREFIRALPEIKAKAALPKEDGGLGPLYSESDWPAAEEIQKRYEFDWSIFDQTVPAQRSGLSSAVIDREAQKARQKWVDAAGSIETGLYTELGNLVARLAERLTDDKETGKARVFHESTVEKLRSFLELLPDRNVTGSGQLAQVAKRCEALLSGTDARAIRDSDSLRGKLREGFQAVAKELDETSSTRSRQFNFNQASGF
jgi:hypothetical protein